MNVKLQERLEAAETIKAIYKECKSELRSTEKDLPENDVQNYLTTDNWHATCGLYS